jgi:multimeric flavodoxin WrbA
LVVALGICGSPRPEGNTRTALLDLLAELKAGGAETGEVLLSDVAVGPIGDCSACVARGGCDIEDEFNVVMNGVYEADLLLVGTPLYWYGPSGQLKLFLDRWSCLLDLEERRFRDRMRGKRVAVVVAQGERGFYEAGPCLQMLDWTFRYLEMSIVARIVVVGHARGDYARDSRQRDLVRNTATEIVAGRPVDLQPPWFHLRHEPGAELGGVFEP